MSRPVSVQDIRQYTARESTRIKKVAAGHTIIRWYRATRLRRCALIRCSIQRLLLWDLQRKVLNAWVQYARSLIFSRRLIFRTVLDVWRAPITDTIIAIRFYERTLLTTVFSIWRQDYGVRAYYIEIVTGNRSPDFTIMQQLQQSKKRNILIFWRARQLFRKCLSIGLEQTVSIEVVSNKVSQSSTNPVWIGYLRYLNSFTNIEAMISSELRRRIIKTLFMGWWQSASIIYQSNYRARKLRAMELQWLRPFMKAWLLMRRTRYYLLDCAVLRWQVSLSAKIRLVEATKAALALRQHAIKRMHFNRWAQCMLGRELLARQHCLEKLYGLTDSSNHRDLTFSNQNRYKGGIQFALFFACSLLKGYQLQATAFRCLIQLRNAVEAPKNWRRLVLLTQGVFYISRLRLYLRAWAFVVFKMKSLEDKRRTFCATDDIIFTSSDVYLLHKRHNEELCNLETFQLIFILSKNKQLPIHKLAALCQRDRHNCILLTKFHAHVLSGSDDSINGLYLNLLDNMTADLRLYLLKFIISIAVKPPPLNIFAESAETSKPAHNFDNIVGYRQTMSLVQRNLAVRYHEFLGATDLLYLDIYRDPDLAQTEQRILAYIHGKFPYLKKTLSAGPVVLLTSAFLLETPAIIFTDRCNVISASFLIQTWLGDKQSQKAITKVSQSHNLLSKKNMVTVLADLHGGQTEPFIHPIPIVDNVYFTGLSRSFNTRGVATLLAPQVRPYNKSITVMERASLATQLAVLKSKRFSISSNVESWVLGAIASASERELRVSIIRRQRLYSEQTARITRSPSLLLTSLGTCMTLSLDSPRITAVPIEIDIVQFIQMAREVHVDRFTCNMISIKETRVTLDEMKRIIETIRTSVIHPSLLLYMNAAKAPSESVSIQDSLLDSISAEPARSLDELLELDAVSGNATMRLIERSFSIAPLSHSAAGSFCMLPDEQLINSSDLSLLQSSQLLSRQNSYVSPSFDQYAQNAASVLIQGMESSRALNPLRSPSNKSRVKSSRILGRKKSGYQLDSSSKSVIKKKRKPELKDTSKDKDNDPEMSSKIIDSPKRGKRSAKSKSNNDHTSCFSGSYALCQDLDFESFHVHVSEESPTRHSSREINHRRSSVSKNPSLKLTLSKMLVNNSLRSSYYSAATTRVLSSGRAYLGVPTRRPNTAVPFFTHRMNNSQRVSDTESSDDIKLREKHRVESATSYRSFRRDTPINSDKDFTSSMATGTLIADEIITSEAIEYLTSNLRLSSEHFTLQLLTHYQKAMLTLRIYKNSKAGLTYKLPVHLFSIPETDIELYAHNPGVPIAALDNIIESILYKNAMLLYENEDSEELFRMIWNIDPYFNDISAVTGEIHLDSTLMRIHFNNFWQYAKFLADEHVYEIIYELDHVKGNKVLRNVHSAPVLYTRMLQCSQDKVQELAYSVAESRPSRLVRKVCFSSSAHSHSGTTLFSHLTLDDLSTDLIYRQKVHLGSYHSKARPVLGVGISKSRQQEYSSQIANSIVNLAMGDDTQVTVSVSTIAPHSATISKPMEPSASPPDASCSPSDKTDRMHLSYTPKMAFLNTEPDELSTTSISRYVKQKHSSSMGRPPKPLTQLTLDDSLIQVRSQVGQSPSPQIKIKPLSISGLSIGKFTKTIHRTSNLSGPATLPSANKRIGKLVHSASRGVLLSYHSPGREFERGVFHNTRNAPENTEAIEPLSDTLDTCPVENDNLPAENIMQSITQASLCNTIVESSDSYSYGELGSLNDLNDNFLLQIDLELNSMQKASDTMSKCPVSMMKLAPTMKYNRNNGDGSEEAFYQENVPITEVSNMLDCLEIIHNSETSCEERVFNPPIISKSAQGQRPRRRPLSGIKIFCSPSRSSAHRTVTDNSWHKDSHTDVTRVSTQYTSSQDQLIEKLGPAITSYLSEIRQQDITNELNLALPEIDDLCKYFKDEEYLSDIRNSFKESMINAYGRDYKDLLLSHSPELLTVTNQYITEAITPQKILSRYSQREHSIHSILLLCGKELAQHVMSKLNSDQIVFNARRDYENCLFNKSKNFKQETFNSILRPRELNKRYEQMSMKIASRVGSRASSRLGIGSRGCSSRGSSPLIPLHMNPGRRRENLMVITVDPPDRSRSALNETESTDIPIRVNEKLFGIDRIL